LARGPSRAALLACLAALTGACPPDAPSSTPCSPPCDETWQQCRSGTCLDVCPGPCGAGRYCNFDTGRCENVVYDIVEEAGPCGPDRDGDTIPDEVEGEADSDGDTTPDADDEDSDGDTIRDRDEVGDGACRTAPVDSDSDTLPDWRDTDSDDDGVPDSVEAGDDRLETRPRDTDGWGKEDFRDVDSDNDGLADAQEAALGTDRLKEDTDGDTWTDLEEWGWPGADPLDPAVGVPEDAQLERVPYDTSSVRRSYVFTVDFKRVDLVLALGCSTDAQPALDDLSRGFAGSVLPGVVASFPGASLGSLIFGDGRSLLAKTGAPVARLAAQSQEPGTWPAAVERLPSCWDGESAALAGEALAEAADGRPLGEYPVAAPCPDGTFGLTCLRPGALPIVLFAASGVVPKPGTSPAPGSARSLEDARVLLRGAGGHLVALHLGTDEAGGESLRELAVDFGSVGPGGTPLVVDAGESGTAGAAGAAEAVAAAARLLTYDVELAAVDLPDDPPPADPAADIDAAQFVTYVDAYRYSPAPGFSREESVNRVDRATFYGTLRGVEVGYRVYYRNGTLRAGPLGLRLQARLVGRTTDGIEIASWEITFVVPCTVGDVTDGR
jgi:hypothetical protein